MRLLWSHFLFSKPIYRKKLFIKTNYIMDVQKYIKRLKFARADMSREIIGGRFRSKDDALTFLNSREFFFGDPFVVKYEEDGEYKLMLAIGKANQPTITSSTTEVNGETGVTAYELFDMDGIKDELERLTGEVSENTENIEELNDAIDAINDIIDKLSGATQDFDEIVGSGWTGPTDNVTITDRIKRDEQLAGIVWGHNDDEPYDGKLSPSDSEIDYGGKVLYVSGDTIMEKIKSINTALNDIASQTRIIDTARTHYDATTEELVIYFVGSDIPVRIPMKDLVDEWTVENSGHTVTLDKKRVVGGKDTLSADVNISDIVSDDDNNMLVAKKSGLYVSNSGITAIETIVNNLKGNLPTLSDGHLDPTYFSGTTVVSGSRNIQEAILKLDAQLVEDKTAHDQDIADVRAELTSAVTDIDERLSADEAKHNDDIADVRAELASAVTEFGDEFDELEGKLVETANTLNSRIASVSGSLDDEIARSTAADASLVDSISNVEDAVSDLSDSLTETAATLSGMIANEASAREAGDVTISASVSDLRSDLEDVSGSVVSLESDLASVSGDVAGLHTELGDVETRVDSLEQGLSAVSEDLGTLRGNFDDFESNTNRAIADLNDGVAAAKTEVRLKDGTIHLTVTSETGTNNHTIYKIGENNIASDSDLRSVSGAVNTINNKIGDGFSDRTITNTIGSGFVGTSITDVLGSGWTQNNSVRHEINYLRRDVNSVSGDVSSLKLTDESFELDYDDSAQTIALYWRVDGSQRHTEINVSDFVKDSFLTSVEVTICSDPTSPYLGQECIKFSFKTYDGQPVPVYIPLSDLAVIYSDGDGIDRQRLENDHVIEVKINSTDKYLTKSADGLHVTGITEAAEEAAERTFDRKIVGYATESYVTSAVSAETAARQNADTAISNSLLATAITLQTQITTEGQARANKDAELEGKINSLSGATGDLRSDLNTVSGNVTNLSSYTNNMFSDIFDMISGITGGSLTEYVKWNDVDSDLDEDRRNPVSNSAVTIAISNLSDSVDDRFVKIEGAISGITGGTLESYVRWDQVDGSMDVNSKNPVSNSAITTAFEELSDDIDERLSGITDMIDSLSASTEDRFSEITNIISGITGETLAEYVKWEDVDQTLDSASTNPICNSAVTEAVNDLISADNELDSRITELSASTSEIREQIEVISGNVENIMDSLSAFTAQTIEVESLTATTANIENLTVNNISGNSAYFENLTANTIYANEYKNLPTATTTQFGVVVVDDELDDESTNPVENRAIYARLSEIADDISELSGSTDERLNEIVEDLSELSGNTDERLAEISNNLTALTENLENNYYTTGYIANNYYTTGDTYSKDEINELIEGISGGTGEHYLLKETFATYTGSTETKFNNYTAYTETELAGKSDTGHTHSFSELENTGHTHSIDDITGLQEALTAITSDTIEVNKLTATSMTVTDAYIENLTAQTIVATSLTVTDADITNLTAQTIVTTSITADEGNITNLTAQTIDATNITVNNISGDSAYFDSLTANTIITNEIEGDEAVFSAITANTIYADEYQNLPTATTENYGVVILDDELDSGSTNPVMNSAVTKAILENELTVAAAFNDLNDRKIDFVDLEAYMPIAGGEFTGNVSGISFTASEFVIADSVCATTAYSINGFYQTSDETLKIFSGDIENPLEKAKEVPTRYFYWKAFCDGPRNVGTSAQKVREVLPEVVNEDQSGKLSVDYAKLSVLAIAAIKELSDKVDELQRQIDELKK